MLWREHPNARQLSRHFKLKQEPDDFLARVIRELNTGTYVNDANGHITFREYAEAWRRDQDHAQGTAVSVEQNLRLHVYPVLGDRPIGAIHTRHIEDLIKRLKKTPVATNKNEPLSAGTIRGIYARVSQVLCRSYA